MRVIRSAGQNISPSDDGALYNQVFTDGLFEDAAITPLGSNQVSIASMYGIIQGREFTNSAETIEVELPASGTATGYIYVQYDLAANPIGSIESALAPFAPVYDDINSTGTLAQMVIATYKASSVAVTEIVPTYSKAMRTADTVSYDNADTGINADNVQDAIDELVANSVVLSGIGIRAGCAEIGNLLIQWGATETITAAGNTIASSNVLFQKSYAIAPNVIVSFDTSSIAASFGRCVAATTGISTTGFTVELYNGDTSQRQPTISWIAIGEKA